MQRACRIAIIAFLFLLPLRSTSFALLSHEAIIDASWDKSIVPLLKSRYPNATAEQLKEARAYAYGGAIVPDIGYYPFGSSMFTHLVHYVRTGDFVSNLISEADSLNELAFAIGAVCHYIGDTYGHPLATNKAVPILFPKLKQKYGDVVTYEQGKVEHVRTEFSFDIIQIAKGRYKPEKYNDFIGFKIHEAVLERAFRKTYALTLDDVFGSLDAATAFFRFTVRNVYPELSKDAWKIHKSIFEDINPLSEKKDYSYKMSRKDYKSEFGKPKPQSVIFFAVIGILPKIGPLSKIKMKEPNEQTIKLFEQTIKTIENKYVEVLDKLHSTKNIDLHDKDLDTGKPIEPGEYGITDKSFYKYLKKLQRNNFENVDENLKKEILAFYSSGTSHLSKHQQKKATEALTALQNTITVTEVKK